VLPRNKKHEMLFDRRIILVLPALVALSLEHAGAFTPVVLGGGKASPSSSHHQAASSRLLSSALASSETTEVVDLSIPYDAAARLAYSAWCTKFSKPMDEARYVSFKANYETITVANVIAIKEYIDAGGDIVGGSGNDRPKDLELNEYGDMTEEEYVAMMAGGGGEATAEVDVTSTPEKGPLETFMEASEAQSEASIALAEAADALAEEEEKLAKQLGMNSIEELEDAIDAMEGYDTDGGAIDTSDVREARVRSAYMDWCKEYGKTVDETRFPTFSSNFLAMEEYSRENGREMVLNKYADCTEEEYRILTEERAPAPVIEEAKVVPAPAPVVVEEPKVEAVAPPRRRRWNRRRRRH